MNRTNSKRVAASVLLALVGPGIAMAQTGLGLDRGGSRQPTYPESTYLEAIPIQESEPVLPAAPNSGPISVNPMAQVPRIRVDEIVIEGSTVFSADEMAAFVAPYEGRTVLIEDLLQLRQAISREYFNRGYVNSGVVLPDQKVTSGIVVMQVIEGNIDDIDLAGNRHLNSRYVTTRIESNIGAPLDINELQNSLQLLQLDPLVRRVNAQLQPGDALGQGRLNVDIVENPPFEIVAAVDNYRAPSVGENEVTLLAGYRSLTGNGDMLRGTYSLSDGIGDLTLAYSLPLTARGLQLEAFYTKTDAEVVEEPFAELDIESELTTWGVTLSRPILFRVDRSVTMFLGLSHKDSESSLLGIPFSFGQGDVNGKAEATTIDFATEYSQRTPSRSWGVRGVLQVGVDALGATNNPEPPDSRFLLFLGQAQYLQRFGWRQSEIVARTSFQFADDPLFTMYKLSVGGRFSVRGYRENYFVRDNGAYATIEYQLQLFVDSFGVEKYGLRGAVFSDYGIAWDADSSLPTSSKDDIWSAGVGLLWNQFEWLQAEVYWGADLIDANARSNTLQDQGFTYQARFSAKF